MTAEQDIYTFAESYEELESRTQSLSYRLIRFLLPGALWRRVMSTPKIDPEIIHDRRQQVLARHSELEIRVDRVLEISGFTLETGENPLETFRNRIQPLQAEIERFQSNPRIHYFTVPEQTELQRWHCRLDFRAEFIRHEYAQRQRVARHHQRQRLLKTEQRHEESLARINRDYGPYFEADAEPTVFDIDIVLGEIRRIHAQIEATIQQFRDEGFGQAEPERFSKLLAEAEELEEEFGEYRQRLALRSRFETHRTKQQQRARVHRRRWELHQNLESHRKRHRRLRSKYQSYFDAEKYLPKPKSRRLRDDMQTFQNEVEGSLEAFQSGELGHQELEPLRTLMSTVEWDLRHLRDYNKCFVQQQRKCHADFFSSVVCNRYQEIHEVAEANGEWEGS